MFLYYIFFLSCFTLFSQETVVYIKWVGLVDTAGEEVATFAAAETSKLVLLGDSLQATKWGKRAPALYMATKMVMIAE